MNLQRWASKNSCDCYFYQVALKLGIDALQAGARRLGLGQPTGIEIPGERGGFIPDRYWKQATFKEPWQVGETLVASIGQGYVLTTPLQLCTLAARIASGMQVIAAHRPFAGRTALPRPTPEPIGFSAKALAAVREGMNAVTNEPGGTGYCVAHHRQAIRDGRQDRHGAGARHHARGTRHRRAHERIACPGRCAITRCSSRYAPVEKPRYACAVVIEHGAVGGASAMCRSRAMRSLFAQQRDILGRAPAYPVKSADASL